MTKKIVRTKSRKSKNTAPRSLGLVRGKRSRTPKSSAGEPKKPAAPADPDPDFNDWIHDAIGGLEGARRAFDNLQVHMFRGRHDLAVLENVIFHEELERALGWLIKLDLEKPWAEVQS